MIDVYLDAPERRVRLARGLRTALGLWGQGDAADDARGLPGPLLGDGDEGEPGGHPGARAQRLALGRPGANDVGHAAVGAEGGEVEHDVTGVEACPSALVQVLGQHNAAAPEGRGVGGAVGLAFGVRGRVYAEAYAAGEEGGVVAGRGARGLVELGGAEAGDELAGTDGVAGGDVDLGEQAGLGGANGDDALGHEVAAQFDGARDRNNARGYGSEDGDRADGSKDAAARSLDPLNGPMPTAPGVRVSECPRGVGDREGPLRGVCATVSVSVHGSGGEGRDGSCVSVPAWRAHSAGGPRREPDRAVGERGVLGLVGDEHDGGRLGEGSDLVQET